MIKRFHALYVGQVELENIGLQGIPADVRRYDNARLSEPFFTARDVAQLMDDLGFYALWTAEHHFQHEGYECFPNLIQLSLWLATQTRTLKLGCAFNVIPMWHPVRLAPSIVHYRLVSMAWCLAVARRQASGRAPRGGPSFLRRRLMSSLRLLRSPAKR